VRGSFDADRAAQLLSNLVANAVTYAPPDGRIVVRVAGTATGVELSVENGGAPIPEAERAGLFDPFRRGTGSGESRGLGLGLFIVQQIARAHGGDVDLVARDGRIVSAQSFSGRRPPARPCALLRAGACPRARRRGRRSR